MFKRILPAGLALCLLTGILPASAMAEGEGVPGLSLESVPAPIAEDGATGMELSSGSCGDNLTWSLSEDGVLTISGTGKMDTFNVVGTGSAPWMSYANQIISVRIGEGTTSIGSCAFYNCTKLESADLPGSIKSMGDNVFNGCSALTELTIPEGVTRIGTRMFNLCASLKSVSIPEGVEEIGGYAFNSCTKLESIVLPKSLKSIKNYAFYNCSLLASADIPEGVTEIGEEAFGSCALKSVTIPEGMISISSHAFYGCTQLTGVTIPESVTDVGEYAFYGCTVLSDVYYTGSRAQWEAVSIGASNDPLTSATIRCAGELASGSCGDNLTWILGEDGTLVISGTGEMENPAQEYDVSWYDYAESIKTVIIEEGAASIGSYAFCGCKNITGVALPESLTKIGTSAFERCGLLTDIVIPQGVVSIGDGAFSGCGSLTDITIPAGVTSIGTNAFRSCDSLADVYYCGEKADWSAIAIGTDNEPLQQAVIHCSDGLTGGIDSGGCGGNLNWILKKDGTLYINGTGPMTDYDGDAVDFAPWYGYRAQITALVIEEGATSIGNYAFMQCAGLTEIALPGSAARIGDYAFTECRGLARAALPKSLKDIGQYAFSDCVVLMDITLPASITRIEDGVFSGCSGLVDISIPENVTGIGAEAFFSCGSLTGVNLPEKVTAIGAGAFSDCGSLTKAVIPEGISTIAEGTFRRCGLTEITLPKSVQSIELAAFFECTALADIYYAGTKAEWEAISVGLSNAPLESAAVHYLGGLANGQCGDSLTWLLSEDGKTLTLSGSGDMWDYSASSRGGWEIGEATIENLVLPQGLTRIGEYAFYRCSALTAAGLPQSVSSIGDFAFSECAALKEMNIPGGTAEIGTSAFAGCSSLAGLRISQGVKVIGTTAFARCSSLQELSLPEGVTEIGVSAFYGCSALKTLHAPKSLQSLGENAFSDCGALQNIYYSGSAQMWQALISPGNDSLQEIAVRCGMLQLFYDANGGSGSMAEETKTVTPGSSAAFTAAQNGFTAPEGSVFFSWNTAADGSGTAYSAGSSLTLSADVTLYAQWKEAQPEPEAVLLEIDGSLQVASGKELKVLEGIDIRVFSGKTVKISGSVSAAGKLQNEGTLIIEGQLQAA
ncbi:MAG: leucine-rich repeat protein, partial [Provencibacterium sp.]|nr:leucine-rich repeat protein [Provencibacterium sp.]